MCMYFLYEASTPTLGFSALCLHRLCYHQSVPMQFVQYMRTLILLSIQYAGVALEIKNSVYVRPRTCSWRELTLDCRGIIRRCFCIPVWMDSSYLLERMKYRCGPAVLSLCIPETACMPILYVCVCICSEVTLGRTPIKVKGMKLLVFCLRSERRRALQGVEGEWSAESR